MKPYPIPADIIPVAQLKADTLGPLRNSIREGEGNFAGYLGQLCAKRAFRWDHPDGRQFDLRDPDTGLTYDCKTKERGMFAHPGWWASVPKANTSQKCDHYLFANVFISEATKNWMVQFMGTMEPVEFYRRAQYFPEGTPDPNDHSGSGFTFQTDCYNVEYGDLNPIELPDQNWYTHL